MRGIGWRGRLFSGWGGAWQEPKSGASVRQAEGFRSFAAPPLASIECVMSKAPSPTTPETQAAQQARAERQAAALRANLKRRKQQKRGRDDAADEAFGPGVIPDATPSGTAG